jgi:septal ring factor EnvC (AmiA/AmiB activator)
MIHATKVRARPVAAMLVPLILAACASAPEPVRDIARAEAGIDQAEQSGARQYGPVELDAARDKLASARAAIAEDEMVLAENYAQEATLAADLAAAKARTGKAQAAVKELEDSIAVLRQEIDRNQRYDGERQ